MSDAALPHKSAASHAPNAGLIRRALDSDIFYSFRRSRLTVVAAIVTLLFFALAIPLLQMFLLGYAVDTNVRQIPTVVMDESRTQESRQFVDKLAASDVFRIVKTVESNDALYGEMRAGRARRLWSRRTDLPPARVSWSR